MADLLDQISNSSVDNPTEFARFNDDPREDVFAELRYLFRWMGLSQTYANDLVEQCLFYRGNANGSSTLNVDETRIYFTSHEDEDYFFPMKLT